MISYVERTTAPIGICVVYQDDNGIERELLIPVAEISDVVCKIANEYPLQVMYGLIRAANHGE